MTINNGVLNIADFNTAMYYPMRLLIPHDKNPLNGMNFHLHGHMCEYIKDYGTVYLFWLFPLEKLNGLLRSYATNARNISIQIMQGFLDYTTFAPSKWPDK